MSANISETGVNSTFVDEYFQACICCRHCIADWLKINCHSVSTVQRHFVVVFWGLLTKRQMYNLANSLCFTGSFRVTASSSSLRLLETQRSGTLLTASNGCDDLIHWGVLNEQHLDSFAPNTFGFNRLYFFCDWVLLSVKWSPKQQRHLFVCESLWECEVEPGVSSQTGM